MSDSEYESSYYADSDDSEDSEDSSDRDDSKDPGDSRNSNDPDDSKDYDPEDYDDSKSSEDSSPPKKKLKLKPKRLHQNVAIKVDGEIYHMNRLQLALKSNYFEKLFVENFVEKNSDVVEIKALNSDTFSAIVELINGTDFKSVVNAKNYVALLMGMDYLQMQINLTRVKNFIPTTSILEIIRLYNFITTNRNFRYFERKVLKYISIHLVKITKHDEKFILCLPFEHFVKVIRKRRMMLSEFCNEKTVEAKQTLSQICSSWIRHDVENRIQHFPAIVNATNYGLYSDFFLIPAEKFQPLLDEIKKDTSQERIERCFLTLLNYSGEINRDAGQFRNGEKTLNKHRIINRINETKKLSRFLEEGILSDVTVRAGAKTYELHRFVLATATTYFSGPIPTSNENPEFVVDIDEKTFDLIVDFIYFDKIPKFDSNSKREIMQMMKAGSILNSKIVIEKCFVPWILKINQQLNTDDFIELLNSAVSNNWVSEMWFFQATSSFYDCEISEDLFRIWQTCEAPGLEERLYQFRHFIMSKIDKMDYENLLITFDTICGVTNTRKYCLYIQCLCKLIVASRSEPSVESHFVSVSYDVLEDLLVSKYFIISDPQKIVDVCSKWIVHDVKNRYRLIPRIIFAINRNSSMNFDEFESNIPTDLGNCSLKDINDELWKLLNSNCVLSRDLGSEPTNWDMKTRPMFILPKNADRCGARIPSEVCVVDSELNEIVSLNFLLNHYEVPKKYDRLDVPQLSATLIGNTLFVLCESRLKFRVYAYNFSSKKLNVLGITHGTKKTTFYPRDTLLNCNNQLFWCLDDGRVMKYSIELNRWLEICPSAPPDHGPYGSDGNELFRRHGNAIEVLDFEQSAWTHFADLPSSQLPSKTFAMRLTCFHNGIALFYWPQFAFTMLLFNTVTRSWKEIPTANPTPSEFSAQLVRYGEDLWYVDKKGIQKLSPGSSSRRWQMMRASSLWTSSSESEFCGIVAIQTKP